MSIPSNDTIEILEQKAKWVRKTSLQMIHFAGSGHPGGSLSEVEILVSLYYGVINIRPNNPKWPGRDRFILSKGHCCPPLYAILADKGYFHEDELWTLRKFGSLLQGHPSIITPGIDAVSGSLGNGLSTGIGMAMAGVKQHRDFNVFVLLGDGELQEGSIWEAAMNAAHHRLNKLVAVVDYNKLQINGSVKDILSIEPLAEKWESFGWSVIRVNGHSFPELIEAFEKAKQAKANPTVIIADTIKGKGISFMENDCVWHGACPSDEQMDIILSELGGK